ncbi:MAG: hypothetical protein ACREVG_20705, partial [Burkholderiales bacterium]
STGLVLEPRRMWRAFRRGCASRNLYAAAVRFDIDTGRWTDVTALRHEIVEVRSPGVPTQVRAAEFAFYSALAMLIHAAIAIPAVIARFVTDITLGYTFFQAVKPKKRADLY